MRLSEIYASVQGEGPRVGEPTTFVRFGGCNLKCAAWPCDSPHAIDARQYRKEWEKVNPTVVFNRIQEIVWKNDTRNICWTGGEPFLQPATELEDLLYLLEGTGLHTECFSNGTLQLPSWAVRSVDFIVDWKLAGSGEDPFCNNRIANIEALYESRRSHAVKFVVRTRADLYQAVTLWERYLREKTRLIVFIGKVWPHGLGQTISDATIVDFVLTNKLPWRLNIQTHNYIWPAHERGR